MWVIIYLNLFGCISISPRGLEVYLYLQQPELNRCPALSSFSVNIYGTGIIKIFHDPLSLQAELVAPLHVYDVRTGLPSLLCSHG